MSTVEIASIAVENTRITHGHELGYIPFFCLVNILVRIIRANDEDLECILIEALKQTKDYFKTSSFIEEFMTLMEKAILFSKQQTAHSHEYINKIGEGWVAEETLAISIYCALRYQNNFKKAIIVAVIVIQ